MNKKILIILIILMIAGLSYYFLKKDSPELQIINQLDEIKTFINTHKPSQNPLQAIGTANQFAKFVTTDIVIQHQTQDLKYDFITTKKNLAYSLAMAQKMYESIEIQWLEIEVTLLSEQVATAEIVTKIIVKKSKDINYEDIIPIKIFLSKIDSKWRISRGFNIDPFE